MDSARFKKAIAAFDRANAEDPNHVDDAGVSRPRELVHAERLSAWVRKLEPEPSEALALAARSQHIRRWQIPRSSFAEGRAGYLQWRTQLGRFHADTASEILSSLGYERELIDAVRRINLKQNLHSNADTQTIEDALCLEFLEFEFEAFAEKHEPEKISEIVRKTWKKMSPRAHELALKLPFSTSALSLIQSALAG
ncbi:MAG TPA: DUF4202 domain-containing protein, partial [Polyangiaceae bacterium]